MIYSPFAECVVEDNGASVDDGALGRDSVRVGLRRFSVVAGPSKPRCYDAISSGVSRIDVQKPMRIVSLLPSATEILCGLGLRDSLVGITHECDYPANVSALPRVTRSFLPSDATSGQIDTLVRERLKTERSLYSIDLERFQAVKPELIVTQSLCDVCAVSEAEVRKAVSLLDETPLIVNLEPSSLADVLSCIREVGDAAGCSQRAEGYIESLRSRIQAVSDRSRAIQRRPTVVLLEWLDPPFSAGHWSPELVELAGGREAIGRAGSKSQAVSWDRVVEADPEVMVIACCGCTVERTLQDVAILRRYPDWPRLRCVRSQRVYLVDGSAYFNRPGPRLVDSLEILAHALHPDVHALPVGRLPALCLTS